MASSWITPFVVGVDCSVVPFVFGGVEPLVSTLALFAAGLLDDL